MALYRLIKTWSQYSRQGKGKATSFMGLLVQVLIKTVFVLEPLIPFFAAYFLNKQLKSWEQRDLIINYTVQIKRTARFCYKIDVHFVLAAHQLENILKELITLL